MKFIIIVSVAFLISCSIPGRNEYTKTLDEIKSEYIKSLKREFILNSTGGGIGGKISLGFKTNACLSISEVRLLLIVMEEEFIRVLNANEKLRSYLEAPSTPLTVEIALAFYQNDFLVESPFIAYAFVYNNVVAYHIKDESGKLQRILKEPYEDAYRTVYGHDREPQVESKEIIVE